MSARGDDFHHQQAVRVRLVIQYVAYEALVRAMSARFQPHIFGRDDARTPITATGRSADRHFRGIGGLNAVGCPGRNINRRRGSRKNVCPTAQLGETLFAGLNINHAGQDDEARFPACLSTLMDLPRRQTEHLESDITPARAFRCDV